MKKHLLRTLLMGIMMVFGAVGAWSQTVTTYDFEDGNPLFTADSRISATVVEGTQTIYSEAFALDGKAVSFKGAGNAQNGYSFAHYDFSSLCDQAAKVKVEFETVLGNGARSIISVGDASVRGNTGNSSKTTYSNKGAIFRVGTDKSNSYVNGSNVGNSTVVSQKWLKVTIEVDEVAKNYTYSIVNKATDEVLFSNGDEPVAFYSSDATNCTQIDMFGYINNSQMGLIDNLVITVTKDEREQANYTVNFLDTSNNPIKDAVVRSGAVGDVITLLPADKDPLWNAEGTQKYIYQSDDADGKTINAAGTTVVNIVYRDAEVYSYTVLSSLGATLATGSGFEGESPRVGYPRYQLDGTSLYMAAVDNKEYRTTVNLTENNVSKTVNYTLQEDKVAAFYTEAEIIDGITVATNDNIPVRASNALAGKSTEDLVITTLPAGKYILHAGIFTSKSSYSGEGMTVNFGIGEQTFAAAFGAVNLNEVASGEYELTAATEIKFLGSTTWADAQFDYIWIEKTGDVLPELVNADFTADEPIAKKICTYAKDVQEGEVANMQPLTGWTIVENGDARAAGTFAYGSTAILGGDGGNVPATGPNGETEGKALGLEAVWNATTQYTQDITLPAGEYLFEAVIYNAAGTGALSQNLIGIDGSYCTTKNYPVGQWTKDQVKINLAEEKTVTVSLGVNSGNVGNGTAPHLFIDHVKLYGSAEIAAIELADAKATLQAEIEAAEALKATEGYTTGVEELAAAIQTAQTALTTATTTEELTAAVEALKAAEAAFVKTNLIAANAALVAGASAETPVNAPFVVNPYFEENVNGWSRTGTYQNSARANNQQGDFTNYFWENWNGSAQLNKMYQVIENIPNGTYKLKIAAFVNTLDDPNDSQFVFANEDKTFLTTGAPTFYEVWTVETDNTMEIGLEQIEAIANWMGIDNVTLTYYGEGDVIDAAKAAVHKTDWLLAKQAASDALSNTEYANVLGAEKTALENEIAKEEPTTAEGYDEATNALTAATSAFTNAKANYDLFATYNVNLAYADASKKPAITSESTADNILSPLRAYYESNALAEGVGGVNMTEKILNADATDGNNSWTWVGSKNDPRNTESWTDSKGKNDYMYFDGGNWGGSSWTTTMEQTITLPSGKYLLTAKGRASDGVTITMSVGENSVDMPHVGSVGNLFDRGWNDSSVLFEADGEATIKVEASAASTHQWFSVGDFRLVQIEELPTAIGSVNTEMNTEGIYNLRGQKVRKAQKGLYIINGKLTVVK